MSLDIANSNNAKAGGAAFPFVFEIDNGATKTTNVNAGMTLRDYFAGQAMGFMHGQIASIFSHGISPDSDDPNYVEKIVKRAAYAAYAIADAMIEERGK